MPLSGLEECWRAQVFKGSREKIPVFSSWLHGQKSGLSRCIIFVEDTSFGRELNELLYNEHNLDRFKEFFQEEDMGTLDSFAEGRLDFPIACDRISEGIDIKPLILSCYSVVIK